MEIKTIKRTATINAPAQKVWDVLIEEKYNTQWYECFMPGTKAETTWQTGSKVTFSDPDGNGITGVITANEPAKLLHITYKGFVEKGKEDFDSEMAKNYAGLDEIYKLTESNGQTILDIEAPMGEEYYDEMSAAWDKAVEVIKKLSEQ